MSRNYDNWERLVGAVLRKEKDRRLAYCESLSSSSSADLSSRFSFVGDVHESADLCSANIFFSRDVKAMEYKEIRKATSNFRPDSTLRGGPYSRNRVYKGWIDENYVAAVKPGSGIAVAVTVESGWHEEGHAGIAYWREEKINLSQYRHPNLVKPIGYYADPYTRIFVKEFMARGSLDRHLFIEQKPLPWATRMRVAVGAARGLAFLHNLKVPVTYGVLKSRDILLDADFNAKLSNCGIAKDDFKYGDRHEIESPWGVINPTFKVKYGDRHEIEGPWAVIDPTFKDKYGPYVAPEFVNADSLSTKCDVYSFGIVLIELMSGLRGQKGGLVWEHLIMDLQHNRRLLRILDGRLEGKYLRREAIKVARIARQCVSEDPRSRPTMAKVVAALEKP